MKPVNPIQMLIDEHVYILKVVAALGVIGSTIENEDTIDAPLFARIIDFMREFADRCHHAKEEDLLFPAMVAMGVPETGCPIGGLLAEHTRGRTLIAQLEQGVEQFAADPQAGKRLIGQAIVGITALYPNHIWKEDDMVFPMAEKLFDAGQLDHLLDDFEAVERNKSAAHSSHIQFANDLETRFGKL